MIGKYCYFVNSYGDWNATMFSVCCVRLLSSIKMQKNYEDK